jgi:hypothetical protein
MLRRHTLALAPCRMGKRWRIIIKGFAKNIYLSLCARSDARADERRGAYLLPAGATQALVLINHGPRNQYARNKEPPWSD